MRPDRRRSGGVGWLRPLCMGVSALALAVILHRRADAGPPYETDDPETPPLRTWEINLALVLHEGTDPASFEAPAFDFNYGLTRTIQLGFGTPIVSIDPRVGDGVTGLGDAGLSVKWRFLEEHGAWPQAASTRR